MDKVRGPKPPSIPRDPGSPKLRMVMEPKYLAFRFGDCTPLAHHLTFGEPGSLGALGIFHPSYAFGSVGIASYAFSSVGM